MFELTANLTATRMDLPRRLAAILDDGRSFYSVAARARTSVDSFVRILSLVRLKFIDTGETA